MSDSKRSLPFDPKEAGPPFGAGFLVGLLILCFFFLLATTMGLPTFVEQWDLPRQ